MVSWWSAKKPRKQTRKAPRWVEKAENRMEYFKLHCSVRSRSVRFWRDDLHDHRGGLRRCLDPEVGQEGLKILEDQINGIELTKKTGEYSCSLQNNVKENSVLLKVENARSTTFIQFCISKETMGYLNIFLTFSLDTSVGAIHCSERHRHGNQ